MQIMSNAHVIACDFDGTLCEEKWPEIGRANLRIIDYLRQKRKQGCKIILWTCREGKLLDDAVEWCKKYDLEFDAVNDNIQERQEMYNGNCRKVSADEYIDDKNSKLFSFPYDADVRCIYEITLNDGCSKCLNTEEISDCLGHENCICYRRNHPLFE